MITLHTRIRNLTPEQEAGLSAYAALFNRVAHHLAAEMVQEKRAGTSFKNTYLKCFAITARQFNAVRQYVEGLADNRVENLKHQENMLNDKIAATQKLLQKIEKQIVKARKDKATKTRIQQLEGRLHQKKRKLGNLLERQSQAIAEIHRPYASGLCFGGRKLFDAQHHLQENDYADHSQWLADWNFVRNSQFFVLGSRDETSGCQGCVARIQADDSFLLDLRLPGDHGSRVTLGPLRFPYQEEKLRAAVLAHAELSKKTLPKETFTTKNGKSHSKVMYPDSIAALSWRFIRDQKGWRVMVGFDMPPTPVTSNAKAGVLAVDLNAAHLAWAELDRFGNPVETGSTPCVTYGKTTEQAAAIIEGAAIALTNRAKQAGKPLVLEKLDFSKRKGLLTEVDGPRYARMLSSLSYRKIHSAISARAAKDGVAVKRVNPAYTSVLGRLHWADRYGLTVHEGAAVAIGRRELRLREAPAHRLANGEKIFKAPDGRDGHVTLVAPVRKRSRHVWSYLSQVNRRLKAALAAQRKAKDPPGHAVSDARKIPNAPVAVTA